MSNIARKKIKKFKPLTLRTNFSWTLVGNIVYAASQWGMLMVLAKLGSPEMVGQFILGLAVTAPVIMFSNLHLRAVQFTDVKQEYLFGDYLSLRLLTTSFAVIAIVSIALSAGYRWETCLVVIIIGLAKAVESISDVFYGLIQQHERMDRLAISVMIKGLLSLFFLSIGVYLTHSVLWGSLGLLIAWTIVLASYDIRSGVLILHDSQKSLEITSKPMGWTLIKPQWQWEKLRKLVWLTLPLGFVMMLISLNTNIPRYFIERYLGERELGFFAAISYLIVATDMVVNALGQSASQRLAQYYAAGNGKDFCVLLIKFVVIGFIMGVLGILVVLIFGKEILNIFYKPEYAKYLDVLVLLMVTALISNLSSFLGYGMTAARCFSVQMPLFLVVTSTSAIFCIWLIPSMGLYGAAISIMIVAIVQAVLSFGVIIFALRQLEKYPLR